MSNEIIKVLDNLCEKIGITVDWTSNNVMPYLQELMGRFIKLQNMQAIMWIVISLILISICIVVIILTTKWVKKNNFDEYDDETEIAAGIYIVSVLILVCFIIIIFCNIYGLFQNIYVPELTLIKYIKNMQI